MKLLTFKRLHLTSPSSPKITPCFIDLLHNMFSFAHSLEEHGCFVGSCPFPLQGSSILSPTKDHCSAVSIITLSMAYFNYLLLIVIRTWLTKKK